MSIQVTSDGEGCYIVSVAQGQNWPAHADLAGSVKEAAGGKSFWGLIVDLRGVDAIDSAGLGAIFSLRRFAGEVGAKIVVTRPTLMISRLLNTVNLPALIPVTASMEEAKLQLQLGAAKPAVQT
jgi:anti-anti-sigma factor